MWRFHGEKAIEIALTTRFDEDKANDADLERVKRHYRVVRLFPVIGGPFRSGVSIVGGPDRTSSDSFYDLQKLFGLGDRARAKKNTVWDIDHLWGHHIGARDYFLTTERRILNKRKRLAALGIQVMDPTPFVTVLENISTSLNADAADFGARLSRTWSES